MINNDKTIELVNLSVWSIEKIQRAPRLGSGSFGTVYQEKNPVTGELFARKLANRESALSSFQKEANILTILHEGEEDGKNRIVGYYGIFLGEKIVSIRLSLAKESLCQRIYSKKNVIDFSFFTRCIAELLEGLSYLESRRVVHADIKPANILITSDDRIQLADFGAAFCPEETSTEQDLFGTLQYIPPEGVLQTGEHSYPADVWSAACSIAEIVLKDVVFRVGRAERDPLDAKIEFRGGLLHWHQNSLGQIYPQSLLDRASLRGRQLLELEPLIADQEKRQKESFSRAVKVSSIPFYHERLISAFESSYLDHVDHFGELYSVLEQMFVFDPQRRVRAEDLLQEPFFQNRKNLKY